MTVNIFSRYFQINLSFTFPEDTKYVTLIDGKVETPLYVSYSRKGPSHWLLSSSLMDEQQKIIKKKILK